MIKSIKQLEEETSEEKTYKIIIEKFNAASKGLGMDYFLKSEYYPVLVKPIKLGFLRFGNSLGDHRIFYNESSNDFWFSRGIDKETFLKIEPILKEIKPEQFVIQLI
jgi:hypothetical protein